MIKEKSVRYLALYMRVNCNKLRTLFGTAELEASVEIYIAGSGGYRTRIAQYTLDGCRMIVLRIHLHLHHWVHRELQRLCRERKIVLIAKISK